MGLTKRKAKAAHPLLRRRLPVGFHTRKLGTCAEGKVVFFLCPAYRGCPYFYSGLVTLLPGTQSSEVSAKERDLSQARQWKFCNGEEKE